MSIPSSESAAHDDELPADLEYTAPGHSYPLTVSPSLCPHTFELQSLRISNDALLLTGNPFAVYCNGLPHNHHAGITFLPEQECPLCLAMAKNTGLHESIAALRERIADTADAAFERGEYAD